MASWLRKVFIERLIQIDSCFVRAIRSKLEWMSLPLHDFLKDTFVIIPSFTETVSFNQFSQYVQRLLRA